MKQDFPIERVLETVSSQVEAFSLPSVSFLSQKYNDPFIILVSTILSARTKDETTTAATLRLFQTVCEPQDMCNLSEAELQDLIYPVGFYRIKAKTLKKMCLHILQEYKGSVPDTMEHLLKLPGVGRKTANLVLGLGFNQPAICVDTHVHRITNRWGYVSTNTPQETEQALRRKLPRPWWITINSVLVRFGQHICRPLSPFCSQCASSKYCLKVAVDRSR
ncbi:endonuclease III domain-containing protein [candidate division CSSED10-310 bacterium]|uniref:Endonuclease III n=1 Tax=candidate division CSSED10-310 bacterium TaxID=2855610 RepID=A0ABV6YXS7_UNCC1